MEDEAPRKADEAAPAAAPAAAWEPLAVPAGVASRCCTLRDEFRGDGGAASFVKGIRWSPDSLCLLALGEDNATRLFEVPRPEARSLAPVLRVREPEAVYDLQWYARMSSADRASCLFATTARDQPIHLWDAFDGSRRLSCCAFDHADEPEHAYSLAFAPDGQFLVAGYGRSIRLFDLLAGGREAEQRELQGSVQLRDAAGQWTLKRAGIGGIVSTLACGLLPDGASAYAAGSYAGAITLYAQSSGDVIASVAGPRSGVTQVALSRDGRLLFAGARRADRIECWDVRQQRLLCWLRRASSTNQRVGFDLDASGRFLATGGVDGRVRFFDLCAAPRADSAELPEAFAFFAHNDCVSGVAFHPFAGARFDGFATCCGSRKLPPLGLSDSSEGEGEGAGAGDGDAAVALWSLVQSQSGA